LLAGLESVSEGQILFDGKDVTKLPASERGIGMVFQNYALWPHMTVRKNIEYGLHLRNLSKSEIDDRVKEVLQITQLNRFVDRLPGQLSGGQQQRVALARALAIRPNVLLLDEPLSNLDAKLRYEMRENICRIHKKTGITTVYVTHDQKEALSMGTSISIMHGGRLIQTGSPRDLYHHPESPFIAGFIGETNIIPGSYCGQEGADFVVETAVGKVKSSNKVGNFKLGDQVFLSIRPEAVKIAERDVPFDENVLEFTLSHLTYLGESEQLQFVKGDTALKANIFGAIDHALHEGDAARVILPKKCAVILPPDSQLGAGT
jgi:ABC-type Fe3+/spermidine/putrescine transport system ATPase subunit